MQKQQDVIANDIRAIMRVVCLTGTPQCETASSTCGQVMPSEDEMTPKAKRMCPVMQFTDPPKKLDEDLSRYTSVSADTYALLSTSPPCAFAGIAASTPAPGNLTSTF